ncbi:hypothetical protein I3F58_08190 [Streptomyces sp. MUM 203J]|uniref:hypothetical protein n=1 Tax=Streptomyces sp. MUM 203J TaxID=2791990 RepID=UPI001F04E258|nr:hypothetical protein [Streptomyces sp. MUM 203J]MCH0539545.1 hypothetical protein [Streptomyces sp. MUM 203J]
MTEPTGARRIAPRADCVADSAGGITFDVVDADVTEPVLVLRLRGSDPVVETRLPLTPAGEGHSRAVLPSTVELAEGRWDAYIGKHAVEPGIRDVRALVGRVHGPSAPVATRIPYPTADGRLAVRIWVRAPHAEAGDLSFGTADCRVTGTLYGARLGPGAVAEARHAGKVHELPVEGGGGDEASGEGGTFAFTVPYGPLASGTVGRERLWQLWLRPEQGAPAVRVARILDDIWDRKNVFVYPEHQGDGYRAAPCYTADNDLCVRVRP